MNNNLPTTPILTTITSLGGLGDGIASHNGKPLFMAKSCVGDKLRVRIVHENHDGYQGVIEEILQSGPDRQAAPCPYFSACGGCSLQQLMPDAYRAFKSKMLQSALSRAGYEIPAEVISLPAASRRRVEFKVAQTNGKFALAYHAPRSHIPVFIDQCLILQPQLQAMITPINAALNELVFAPQLYSVGVTMADSGIDMMLTFKDYNLAQLPPLDALCKKLGVARICARNRDSKAQISAQIAPVEMRLGAVNVALPPEAFLQATAQGQMHLTQGAIDATKNSESVVDLFCGIGTYSFPLSEFTKVHTIEGDADMVATIKKHAPKNITAQQRDLFKNPLSMQELARFDAAIINPPRIGAKAQTEQLAHSSINSIYMVSCNPASFGRDAKILKNAGFHLEKAQAIDQFVYSAHLEIMAHFKR